MPISGGTISSRCGRGRLRGLPQRALSGLGAGGGVKGEIVRRRAARLRFAILRGEGHTPIATVVWNLSFSSASHGARAFVAAYGVPPGPFRGALLRPGDGAVGDLKAGHMRGRVEVLNAKSSTV